jgi:glycosyltransferase involved in cell wall biosynthesis
MDIVDHQQNGYVANHGDIEDLAQGIAWVLEDEERHQKLCVSAREKAERDYTLELDNNHCFSLCSLSSS